MSTSILFSDTPEHFYQQLRECIQQTIQKELSTVKKDDEEIYLKKHEVCKMLQVSKPTIDSHVKRGYYKKHSIGSRMFYNKSEILAYLNRNKKAS
jgi:predicted DNA-binding transcriptional regulator AlpA